MAVDAATVQSTPDAESIVKLETALQPMVTPAMPPQVSVLEKTASETFMPKNVWDGVIACAIIFTRNSSGSPTIDPSYRVTMSLTTVGDGLTLPEPHTPAGAGP